MFIPVVLEEVVAAPFGHSSSPVVVANAATRTLAAATDTGVILD